MIRVRKSEDRGSFDFGWLDTRHTFSFGDYLDPEHMGFRVLRVLNEDRVRPAEGFPTHSHRDMEILTWVLSGALEHRDSLGNGSVIRPGEIQRMGAGTGVSHSEFNASSTEPVHFLQIWIHPARRGLTPAYSQEAFPEGDLLNRLRLVASPEGAQGSVAIAQDARVYVGRLESGASLSHPLPTHRHAWVQVTRGPLSLNGILLSAGDGAAVSGESILAIRSAEASEVILFDLP
ncbi:MAG: pirin family protein [Acidobacteriota bacterium]